MRSCRIEDELPVSAELIVSQEPRLPEVWILESSGTNCLYWGKSAKLRSLWCIGLDKLSYCPQLHIGSNMVKVCQATNNSLRQWHSVCCTVRQSLCVA